MKKNKLTIIIGGVLVILLIATVAAAVKATSAGTELIVLENKAADLENQNQELNYQIVQNTSLSQVAKEAERIGMTSPQSFVYLTLGKTAVR